MKPAVSKQKLRGGYYTPAEITDFLCAWAIVDSNTTVLEPSCGNGAFLESAAKRLIRLGAHPAQLSTQLIGAEVEASEAELAARRIQAIHGASCTIHSGDFFAYSQNSFKDRRFDAVIGNPPFIRYQNFAEEHRRTAFELMTQAGLRPNRLTNAWTPFVVASTQLLKPGGRLAMVIPAELLQVGYAAELRRFLSSNYTRLTIFAFRHLVFGEIQQEVILVCGERGRPNAEDAWIRTVELNDLTDLISHTHTEFERAELKVLDHSSEKWTQYFLSNKELELIRRLRAHRKLSKLRDVASVDVGVVTGMNEFFVLSASRARELRLRRHTHRLVTRSAQLRGIAFTNRDWQNQLNSESPALLLNLPKRPKSSLGAFAKRYVQYGERQNFHTGYKCSIRDPWYGVPSIWVPDGFLLRQIHGYPKLILNRASATCTDTIHRVRILDRREKKNVATAFLNSVTFAFSEILGRSYGGGVLELEPNEADSLPIPLVGSHTLELGAADRAIRSGDDLSPLLDEHDAVLLINGLGLTSADVRALRAIWIKLRDRRIARKVLPRRQLTLA